MANGSKMPTPENTDEEGEVFTDADFGDTDDDLDRDDNRISNVAINETVNTALNTSKSDWNGTRDEVDDTVIVLNQSGNSEINGSVKNDLDNSLETLRDSDDSETNTSIVGILGGQQNHAEQRLAARRAARAEAREIRMRELERQQREQEDHADKAYDMYTETVGRRAGSRLAALSPGLHSPRRSSEDSDEVISVKDLRHDLKEVEEKFRKAMILNAQLDNDKAALGYQLELMRDRIEELQEEYAQLQREHKEKCSSHERLKREHAALEREVVAARDAVRARDAAADAAGYSFVEAGGVGGAGGAVGAGGVGAGFGDVPPLALLSHAARSLLDEAGDGTLDVRLEKLASCKTALESEVRKLKLQLNEERSARQNGVTGVHDREYETEVETLRKCVSEAKGRAARAEAEAALGAGAVARLEAQVARLRARLEHHDHHEEELKGERRRLQREAREALNRVEELETENSHLTKRLDKLKNAKSALLKEL
ncbi:leucine-rich repeat flightless-interacting protein 2 [Leptidea sinapis]|nr:leucine-rich repeat flightless-interacting protein 2 [Leptidea sinapis]